MNTTTALTEALAAETEARQAEAEARLRNSDGRSTWATAGEQARSQDAANLARRARWAAEAAAR